MKESLCKPFQQKYINRDQFNLRMFSYYEDEDYEDEDDEEDWDLDEEELQ